MNNILNVASGNSKFHCESVLRINSRDVKLSDFTNLPLSQFMIPAFISNKPWLQPQINGMFTVLTRSNPFKIFNPVVSLYSIFVIYLREFFWIWNEMLHHKAVNSFVEISFILTKGNEPISPNRQMWLQNIRFGNKRSVFKPRNWLYFWKRFYPPKIADLITSLKSIYIEPCFFHNSIL